MRDGEGREKQREMKVLSAGSFPKCAQEPGLSQTKALKSGIPSRATI